MLLYSLCLATHILATSSLGFSVTRPSKSFLAERELEVSICVILASVLSLSAGLQTITQPVRWPLAIVTFFLAIWPESLSRKRFSFDEARRKRLCTLRRFMCRVFAAKSSITGNKEGRLASKGPFCGQE